MIGGTDLQLEQDLIVDENVNIGGNLTVDGEIFGGYIEKYLSGNFIGSLYTSRANSTGSDSNAIFQVMSDTRGTPQFQVQNGGVEQASFIARSFMVVNQNNTLLNSSQNNLCSTWGFTELDCNTATTGADMGVTDDFQALGLIYGSGLRAYKREGKQRAPLILAENISSVYSGTNGQYNAVTNIFCDDIFDSFAGGGWININDPGSDYEGAWADISGVINSSCIELKNNPAWLTSFSGVQWRTTSSPLLIYLLGGFGEYYIGNSPRSGFKFKTKNGTGAYGVVIDDTVGATNHKAFEIEQDMNGFSTIAQNIYMYSTKQLVDKESKMLSMIADASNMNSSDGVFIDMNIIGQPLTADGHIDGIHMPSGMTHLIEVGSSETIASAYYEATNITGIVTNSSTIQIFTNDNDLIYVGSTLNFTSIGITLSIPSSTTIAPLYYYCNSAGNWQSLTGVTSTTGGFISSGAISFINPTDRGKCNKELDGTPFSDTTTYSYIAVQRTRNFIVTPPVLDKITISGASVNMFLSDDMMRLHPVDTAPEVCNAAILGAIYYDTDNDFMCVCRSSGWFQMDDGTTGCT